MGCFVSSEVPYSGMFHNQLLEATTDVFLEKYAWEGLAPVADPEQCATEPQWFVARLLYDMKTIRDVWVFPVYHVKQMARDDIVDTIHTLRELIPRARKITKETPNMTELVQVFEDSKYLYFIYEVGMHPLDLKFTERKAFKMQQKVRIFQARKKRMEQSLNKLGGKEVGTIKTHNETETPRYNLSLMLDETAASKEKQQPEKEEKKEEDEDKSVKVAKQVEEMLCLASMDVESGAGLDEMEIQLEFEDLKGRCEKRAKLGFTELSELLQVLFEKSNASGGSYDARLSVTSKERLAIFREVCIASTAVFWHLLGSEMVHGGLNTRSFYYRKVNDKERLQIRSMPFQVKWLHCPNLEVFDAFRKPDNQEWENIDANLRRQRIIDIQNLGASTAEKLYQDGVRKSREALEERDREAVDAKGRAEARRTGKSFYHKIVKKVKEETEHVASEAKRNFEELGEELGNLGLDDLTKKFNGLVKLVAGEKESTEEMQHFKKNFFFNKLNDACFLYHAPELYSVYFDPKLTPISPIQDMWSLGVVLYYIVFGTHPLSLRMQETAAALTKSMHATSILEVKVSLPDLGRVLQDIDENDQATAGSKELRRLSTNAAFHLDDGVDDTARSKKGVTITDAYLEARGKKLSMDKTILTMHGRDIVPFLDDSVIGNVDALMLWENVYGMFDFGDHMGPCKYNKMLFPSKVTIPPEVEVTLRVLLTHPLKRFVANEMWLVPLIAQCHEGRMDHTSGAFKVLMQHMLVCLDGLKVLDRFQLVTVCLATSYILTDVEIDMLKAVWNGMHCILKGWVDVGPTGVGGNLATQAFIDIVDTVMADKSYAQSPVDSLYENNRASQRAVQERIKEFDRIRYDPTMADGADMNLSTTVSFREFCTAYTNNKLMNCSSRFPLVFYHVYLRRVLRAYARMRIRRNMARQFSTNSTGSDDAVERMSSFCQKNIILSSHWNRRTEEKGVGKVNMQYCLAMVRDEDDGKVVQCANEDKGDDPHLCRKHQDWIGNVFSSRMEVDSSKCRFLVSDKNFNWKQCSLDLKYPRKGLCAVHNNDSNNDLTAEELYYKVELANENGTRMPKQKAREEDYFKFSDNAPSDDEDTDDAAEDFDVTHKPVLTAEMLVHRVRRMEAGWGWKEDVRKMKGIVKDFEEADTNNSKGLDVEEFRSLWYHATSRRMKHEKNMMDKQRVIFDPSARR